MAVATRNTRTSIAAATTVTAGTPSNGTSFDMRTAISGTALGTIINGGTGPTISAQFCVQMSTDNATWVDIFRASAGTAASTTYPFAFVLPPDTAYHRVVIDSNTGQNVTGYGVIEETTSIG